MKPESPSARPSRSARRPRILPFRPVPVRERCDGWTPRRQTDFLGYLAETGSVAAACRHVGLSREAAYSLRRRAGAESFAAAWDAALGAPVRNLTDHDLEYRAMRGLIRPVMRNGKYVGTHRKPDNSALLRLLARFDRLLADDERSGIVGKNKNAGFPSTELDGFGFRPLPAARREK